MKFDEKNEVNFNIYIIMRFIKEKGTDINMPYIKLRENRSDYYEKVVDNPSNSSLRIKVMIFTEGTVIGHKNLFSIWNFASYIPIGNCVSKIKSWQQQGAEIIYVTSRRTNKQVAEIASVLKKYEFPGNLLYFRGAKQRYKDLIELVIPDVLIEDDCKSIGGQNQMCITYVNETLKMKIKSVPVAEFGGIDHLPDMIFDI